MNDLVAIETAGRLQELGIFVRSAEIREKAEAINQFYEKGGNRAMRRAAKRAQKKRGH